MNKLQELVYCLNGHEEKTFRIFLSSPYFNTDPSIVNLFEAILKNRKTEIFSKQLLFKQLFRNKKYDDKKMRYLVSKLTKHIEYFLTMRHIDKNEPQYLLHCTEALAAKDCEKAFAFAFNEVKRKSSIKNATQYYHLHKAYETHLNNTFAKQPRKVKLDYGNVLLHLDSFYLSKKLQLFCEITNLKNILSRDYPMHLLAELRKLAQHDDFKNVPVVQVYYHVLLTLTEPGNENHFMELKNSVAQNGHLFPVNELKELYQYVKNYCIKKINSSQPEYIQALFSIYKEMLTDRRLMYDDYFSQWEFKNVVNISLRLNEKEWCKNFIPKYINYLKPSERKNALAFNLAYLHFMNGNFKEAIKRLKDVEFTDVFYKVDSKVILMKCYYELDEIEFFFYHASAFRLFLLRNRQLSPYQKRMNRNLIIFLSRLVRAGMSPVKIARLKKEVLEEKSIADLNWLLERINGTQALSG
ncbi:MAG TPA: hypothetical protein VJY62_06810 [Bacteroidia bacterium]|nr:hypothetical protein [Bacteroidia bacterium]